MTDRRRFFPAKTVQQVPGQKVEVEVELARNASCPCAPTSFAWAATSMVYEYADVWDDDKIKMREIEPDLLSTDWSGDQYNSDQVYLGETRSIFFPKYVDNDMTRIVQKHRIFAIPLGPSGGLSWSFGFDKELISPMHDFIAVKQEGSILVVESAMADEDFRLSYTPLTLTATASCGSRSVGTISLLIHPGWW